MSEDNLVREAVERYLARVAAELTDVSPEEKDEILKGVESHIYEALEKRSPGAATMADLGAVLADMAPPWSYAREHGPHTSTAGQDSERASVVQHAQPVPVREPRLCWYPVAGSILALLSLVVFAVAGSALAAVALPAISRGQGMPVEFTLFLAPVITVVLALPIVSMVLGILGISKIRAMRGALYGMPLAVIVAIVFPCAILDLLVLIASKAFLPSVLMALSLLPSIQHPTFSPLPISAIFLVLLVVILLDVAIYRRVSRWANRPLEPGVVTCA